MPKTGQVRSLHSLEPATSIPANPDSEKICEPRISLQSDGDRITNIRVQCSCGQIMDLACVYESTAKPV